MPYDANLIFHDGTTLTADQSPTSTTRVNGSAVLDLKETGAKGLVAVMICGADQAEDSDTILVTIQECATVDGTYTPVAVFATLTQGTDTLPATFLRRFTATERYVRAQINITDSDSGNDYSLASCYILLSQYPFYKL